MNFCLFGGQLVSAAGWVPSAPFDFRWPGATRPPIGCNNIHCSQCDEIVRQREGLAIDPASSITASTLASAPDWSAVTGVVPDPASRLYSCTCHVRSEHATTDLDHPAQEALRPLGMEWHCAGHPALAVPTLLDGDPIGDDTDFATLAEQRLARPGERLPDGVTLADVGVPSFWLVRLYRLLEHSSSAALTAKLAAAVVSEAKHPSAEVRLGALTFFNIVKDAPEADALARVAAEDATRFEGAVEVAGETWELGLQLQSLLLARLLQAWERGEMDEAARDALRARMLQPGRADRFVLAAMADVDDVWLLEHAIDIATNTPDRLDSLVRLLSNERTEDLVRVLGAIADVDAIGPEAVAEHVNRIIEHEDDKAAILAHLARN